MNEGAFRGTLRQHYRLKDKALLVLEEGYEGEIGPAERVKIVAEGREWIATVHELAWGSTMNAARLPLSLVVRGLDEGDEPPPGATIHSV
ncbi:MAG: hypothetical protein AB7S26_16840 [Sandaracinaceae bacterium]